MHKERITDLVGILAGSGSGCLGMMLGKINVVDDIHALIIAVITGAAGFIGAKLIEIVYNRWFKKHVEKDH